MAVRPCCQQDRLVSILAGITFAMTCASWDARAARPRQVHRAVLGSSYELDSIKGSKIEFCFLHQLAL